MPARTATKRTTGARRPAARKPAKKAVRKPSTTIVLRRARAPARAASLSLMSPYDDEYSCVDSIRGYAPMTFEELEKKLLADYACRMKSLCLRKKNFVNSLICKYGEKPGAEDEPASINRSEAEYVQDLDLQMDQLGFDVQKKLAKEKFKYGWKTDEVVVRQRVLGPDVGAILELEEKYGPRAAGDAAQASKGRLAVLNGAAARNATDPLKRAAEVFGVDRSTVNNPNRKGGNGNFGDYDYGPGSYESFLDYY